MLNGLLLRQQLAQPGAVRAQLNAGTQIWTSGTFTTSSTDSLSSHAYNQLVGIDATIDTNKHLGVFVGSTQNSHKLTALERSCYAFRFNGGTLFQRVNTENWFYSKLKLFEQLAEFAQGMKTHSQTQNMSLLNLPTLA